MNNLRKNLSQVAVAKLNVRQIQNFRTAFSSMKIEKPTVKFCNVDLNYPAPECAVHGLSHVRSVI